MSEVTEHLIKAREGDPEALGKVFDLVYPELKRLAAYRLAALPPGATLTPTALVSEVYLRLKIGKGLEPSDRHHLMACAARAMRYILVDRARSSFAVKRGGGQRLATLTEAIASEAGSATELLDVDRALDALGAVNPPLRELVELRFFAGLDEQEIAELRGVSPRTVRREWQRARAFLHVQMAG